MNKRLTFHFYSDPGHGWLKVKKSLLTQLDIADKITEFSFTRHEYAYLEEDLDACTFLNRLKKEEIEPIIKTHSSYKKRSKIRSYMPYRYPLDKPYVFDTIVA